MGAFALILDDPDAPPGLWIHWVLFNLPPELPAGFPPHGQLENGSLHGACWGVESFSRRGHAGPLPPPGPAHRYRFRLSALDAPLPLPPGATAAEVRAAMADHILAEAELVGRYQRGHGLITPEGQPTISVKPGPRRSTDQADL